MSNKSILSLYRKLLRNAEYFPSRNKKEIIIGIKEDFRQYSTLTDPKKIQIQLEQANSGLERFQTYINSFVDPNQIKPHHQSLVVSQKQVDQPNKWHFTL